jgi:hypothetical protein
MTEDRTYFGLEAECIPDITFNTSASQGCVPYCLDTVVADPQRDDMPLKMGEAARRASRDKERKYGDYLTGSQGTKFLPIAIETFGCFGEGTVKLLDLMAAARTSTLAADQGAPDSCTGPVKYFYAQCISVSFMKRQAQVIRRRCLQHHSESRFDSLRCLQEDMGQSRWASPVNYMDLQLLDFEAA